MRGACNRCGSALSECECPPNVNVQQPYARAQPSNVQHPSWEAHKAGCYVSADVDVLRPRASDLPHADPESRLSQPATSTPDCADCGDVQAGTRSLDGRSLCEACLGEAVAPPAWSAMLKALEDVSKDGDLDVEVFDPEKCEGVDGIEYIKKWFKKLDDAIDALGDDASALRGVCEQVGLEADADEEEVHDAIEELLQPDSFTPDLLAIPSVDAALIREAADPAHALDLYLAAAVRK